jgi:outer membrane protein OmpA-like peptidoglycan-associated protein
MATTLVLEMEVMKVNEPIVLKNIYYDFNKADIRPDAAVELDRLVKIMNDNPTIVVVLSSHTDSRGSNDYNQRLSQRRAESAVKYIQTKNIPQARISAKGFGESKLLNNCKDGVKCTDAQHQENRRTEFTVTGFTDEPIRSDR